MMNLWVLMDKGTLIFAFSDAKNWLNEVLKAWNLLNLA